MATPVYPSDLTDAEWALLAPLLPPARPGGRPRSVDVRRILNGLFYLVRSGCAWRYLPCHAITARGRRSFTPSANGDRPASGNSSIADSGNWRANERDGSRRPALPSLTVNR